MTTFFKSWESIWYLIYNVWGFFPFEIVINLMLNIRCCFSLSSPQFRNSIQKHFWPLKLHDHSRYKELRPPWPPFGLQGPRSGWWRNAIWVPWLKRRSQDRVATKTEIYATIKRPLEAVKGYRRPQKWNHIKFNIFWSHH